MTNNNTPHTKEEEFIKLVFITLSDISKLLPSSSSLPQPSIISIDTENHDIAIFSTTLQQPVPEIQNKVNTLLDEIKLKFPEVVQQSVDEIKKENDNTVNNTTILPDNSDNAPNDTNNTPNYINNTTTNTNNTANITEQLAKASSVQSFIQARPTRRTSRANDSNKTSQKYYTIQPKSPRGKQTKHNDHHHVRFLGFGSKMKKEKSEELELNPIATPTELKQRNMKKLIDFFGDNPATPGLTSTPTNMKRSKSNQM